MKVYSLYKKVAVLAAIVAMVSAASITQTTSTSSGGLAKEAEICQGRTPCAWAVYIPISRELDYFIKNTCECPNGKICVSSDDNLSASAYVHRCRVPANSKEADAQTFTESTNPI